MTIEELGIIEYPLLNEEEVKIFRDEIIKIESWIMSLSTKSTYLSIEQKKWQRSILYTDKITNRNKELCISDYYDHWKPFSENEKFKTILLPKLTKIFDKLKFERPMSLWLWPNIFRKGQGISIHSHGQVGYNGGWGAQISIQNNGIGTTYLYPADDPDFLDGEENYCEKLNNNCLEITEVSAEGNVVLFPGKLAHYSKPNTSNKFRISIAFQIFPGFDNTQKDSTQHVIR